MELIAGTPRISAILPVWKASMIAFVASVMSESLMKLASVISLSTGGLAMVNVS